MRVAKAKRRWLKWCRYVAATQSQSNRSRGWGTDIHTGQAKAFEDVSTAGTRAMRWVWYPKWGAPGTEREGT